ncbi:DUF4190 domain-containing protein [Nocardia carnea]|uniref:DUF4190 domain-containing protein n=1 Tax=Nocardia carnea TaxID=37328 RepID=UPI002458C2D3|nr:DUF4190 domain-containing protein [Nocardia carnea]
MTNPGNSDEWWKQYGGSGVSSDPANAQPSAGEPSSYPSYPSSPAPAPMPPPATPTYGVPPTPAPQANPYPAMPAYPANPSYPGTPQGPGYPMGYQPYGYPPAQAGTNGLAIASLIASLVGIGCGIGAIAGIIMGVIALGQIRENGQQGRGMALGGIWVGVAWIVLWVLYVVLIFAASA